MNTDVEEMRAFIGMAILMGIHRLPQVRDYWSGAWGLGVPEISAVMPLYRFESIHHFLHVSNNSLSFPKSHPLHDKMQKVRPFLNLIQSNYMKYYIPHQPVSIDESMTAFKGRCSMKQYMPLKPIKRGFKSWSLGCPLSGYTFAMEPYIGKTPGVKYDENLGTRVVYDLAMLLPNTPGYIVHCDRFFTSVELCLKLLDNDIYMVGTTLVTKKQYPEDLTRKSDLRKLKRGDMLVRSAKDKQLIAVVWKDKKPIHFLSTAYPPSVTTTCERKEKDGTKITIPCPAITIGYNKGMGGVDISDQLAVYYAIGHATKKWWPRLMWRYMDTAFVNSFLLFKLTSPSYKGEQDDMHKRFRLSIAQQLISGFCARKNIGRPLLSPKSVGVHDMVKLPGRIQQCRYCQEVNKRKKRSPRDTDSPVKRPRESTMGCVRCKVHLCKGVCFQLWHSDVAQ